MVPVAVPDLVLVRPMKPLVQTAIACAIGVSITSCATSPEIGGDYPLSRDDIHQIILLVQQRSDIRKPILSIFAFRADRASVQSGSWDPQDYYSEFFVAKRRGRWQIDSKIWEERTIVTGSAVPKA